MICAFPESLPFMLVMIMDDEDFMGVPATSYAPPDVVVTAVAFTACVLVAGTGLA
jgi:hypothetical protein